MGWVDTHCHLQMDGRAPAGLLARAADVDWVVAPGVDLETSQASRDLAAAFPGKVLASAGLHPHEA
ncbi:MAG TPA: TatD family hydrolase, partial [Acidimicrobiia bacterium]|nr:TatD family hydrolase [Acidimicrobiia bacterium]